MKTLDWIECRIWGLAILLFFGFLAPVTLFAQQTWDYTGATMTGTYLGGSTTVIPALDVTSISGDIVLAQALAPNAANQVVTPVSFNFGSLLNSSAISAGADTFSFTTVNGNVVGWNISVSGQTNGSAAWLTSTQAGDNYTADGINPFCNHVPSGCSVYVASSSMGGMMVDPPAGRVQAPELDLKQAVSALTLLCSLVLVVKSKRA